jgi:NTE family protein
MGRSETLSGTRLRVGLALGGGAARGAIHLGVLQVLERENIPLHCVAGTSVGSVIGAAYCAGLRLRELREVALQIGWRNIASLIWPSQGFLSFAKLERLMIDLLGDLDFADLAIPFAALATDLVTGEPVILKSGRLAPAVRASCSIPGIVKPASIQGRLLIDGFASDNLPVQAARSLGADFVIAVDICRSTSRRGWGPLRIGFAAIENLARRAGGGHANADCLISPNLAGFSYTRFSQHAALIARGIRAAEAKVPSLQAALNNASGPTS